MRTIILLILLVSTPAFAQDKPQPKASETPVIEKTINDKLAPPAEATLSLETVKALEAKNQTARLAQLEVENLQLKIAQAQRDLKELQEAAQKVVQEAQSALVDAAVKAGIPRDKLSEYEISQNKDGSASLKKRAPKQ